MENDLVSIIIPFYNEEKNLARAVLSAVNQTYKNIEILLINDGSTDDSLSIAEILANNHSSISLFSIKNSGLSIARNRGMKKCNGKYLSFLDSDDEFEKTAIEQLVKDIEKNNSCISICKFNLKNEQSEFIMTGGWKSNSNLISNKEAILKMYKGEITYTAWAKLYRTSIAKEISFPEGLWFEDRPFFLDYLIYSEKVSFVEEPLLSIYTSPNSISRRTISKKRITDLQSIWELEIAKKNTLEEKVIELITTNHINSLFENAIFLSLDKKETDSFNELVKVFKKSIKETKQKIKEIQTPLKNRSKLNFLILQSINLFGWNIFEVILKMNRKNQIFSIKKLRNH